MISPHAPHTAGEGRQHQATRSKVTLFFHAAVATSEFGGRTAAASGPLWVPLVQVRVFPHLRAVLKACRDVEAAVPPPLWEFVQTGQAAQVLLVTPGSSSCFQLVGGPAEGVEADDRTSVEGPSDGLRVSRVRIRVGSASEPTV